MESKDGTRKVRTERNWGDGSSAVWKPTVSLSQGVWGTVGRTRRHATPRAGIRGERGRPLLGRGLCLRHRGDEGVIKARPCAWPTGHPEPWCCCRCCVINVFRQWVKINYKAAYWVQIPQFTMNCLTLNNLFNLSASQL